MSVVPGGNAWSPSPPPPSSGRRGVDLDSGAARVAKGPQTSVLGKQGSRSQPPPGRAFASRPRPPLDTLLA